MYSWIDFSGLGSLLPMEMKGPFQQDSQYRTGNNTALELENWIDFWNYQLIHWGFQEKI